MVDKRIPEKIKEEELVESTPEDEKVLISLRAKNWSEFHGQQGVKDSLQIAIEAAQRRD